MENQKSSKPMLSPTQIGMYTRCGEQYRRRYVLREVMPPGISLLKGSAVHSGAEHNFRQKLETHEDLPEQEVIDCAVSTFEETIKHEGISLTFDEESRGKSVVIGEGKDSAAILARIFMVGNEKNKPVAPKYQPAEVEAEQVIELPTIDLKGIIDLKTDGGNIVELKTSKRSWDMERVERDMQLTFYGMLDKAKTGIDPKPMILENLVDTKEPKIVTHITSRNHGDFLFMINRINRVVDGINKGVFPPAPVDSWCCDPRYCGYYAVCEVKPRR